MYYRCLIINLLNLINLIINIQYYITELQSFFLCHLQLAPLQIALACSHLVHIKCLFIWVGQYIIFGKITTPKNDYWGPSFDFSNFRDGQNVRCRRVGFWRRSFFSILPNLPSACGSNAFIFSFFYLYSAKLQPLKN
jgi:hypothetical protein